MAGVTVTVDDTHLDKIEEVAAHLRSSGMHVDNVFRPRRFARLSQERLDNTTARLCARIVAVSQATAAALVSQGYPSRRVLVVRNGDSQGADHRYPPGKSDAVSRTCHKTPSAKGLLHPPPRQSHADDGTAGRVHAEKSPAV